MKLIRMMVMFALAGFATRLYLDHRPGRIRSGDDDDAASGSLTP